MSAPINDGGPAFPSPIAFDPTRDRVVAITEFAEGFSGMTLRDYFAAAALQGLIAGTLADGSTFIKGGEPFHAAAAYATADAMLAVREKGRS